MPQAYGGSPTKGGKDGSGDGDGKEGSGKVEPENVKIKELNVGDEVVHERQHYKVIQVKTGGWGRVDPTSDEGRQEEGNIILRLQNDSGAVISVSKSPDAKIRRIVR